MTLIRINRNPSGRQLFVFALTWLGIFCLLGWIYWRRGRHPVAEFAWALAVAVPLVGGWSRKALRWVYLALCYATYPIGLVVSHVILAAVYFLALTPIGFALRLFGHDPLSRRFDRKARSYWQARGENRPSESYFKQG